MAQIKKTADCKMRAIVVSQVANGRLAASQVAIRIRPGQSRCGQAEAATTTP
jgi:hypothetical protein